MYFDVDLFIESNIPMKHRKQILVLELNANILPPRISDIDEFECIVVSMILIFMKKVSYADIILCFF
jgi:hypothetical protein